MELQKIGEAKWQLPKQGDMNVPLTIFGTKGLVDMMQRDRSFSQARNVASMPGIVKSSFIMPDGHEGYGFPIGGVAAFDKDAGGVISPGGVGYDINCISGDSKILSEFGFHRHMEEFAADFSDSAVHAFPYSLKMRSAAVSLSSLNARSRVIEPKPALCFMEKMVNVVKQATTAAGLSIKATSDHPFLTRNGMRKLGELSAGEEVAVTLFEGVEYQPQDFSEIVAEDAVGGAAGEELKKRGLLPLHADNPKLPYLARILGYLMGDGLVYFSSGKGYVCAYGKQQDLELMKKDVAKIGFSAKIYARARNHRIEDQYGEKKFFSVSHELHVNSSAFARLLVALGMPLGRKTSARFGIPNWVRSSRKWMKRLFLSGLFSAELSSPKTHSKTGFYAPVFSQNKNEEFVKAGRDLFVEIIEMLEELDVKCTKLSVRKEFKNREGPTHRLRLLISANEENLLKLWRTIGFDYSSERRELAEIASLYILKKKRLTKERAEIAARVKRYKRMGLKLRELQKLLASNNANARFIERSYYEDAGQRITLSFDSFEEFVRNSRRDIQEHGVLFDEIETISEVPYSGKVYDFTIEKNHNFIANGFVVSNCGVRLIRTELTAAEVKPKIKELINKLFQNVPSGVGSKGKLRVETGELELVLMQGSKWAIYKGYGWDEDAELCEEGGGIEGANPESVSDQAKKRGTPQLGTLGAGNHFLEVQEVSEVADEKTAEQLGLEKGKIAVMLHCGSRGFGHQVCDDYIRVMLGASRKYNIKLPDRELCCAPIGSPEAKSYVGAMYAAVNYAFCNRQVMTHWIRETFEKVFGRSAEELGMHLMYDVCHNIAKFEEHAVEGERKMLCVHRKGATRAFGPGREEIPQCYRSVGQPVIIPGSMGTASYVLVGTKQGMEEAFGSTCHGSGRTMSRGEAIRTYSGEQIQQELAQRGITVKATSGEVISEEAPGAYKDVDEVVKSVELAGISKIVARLVPIGVAKG